MVRTDWTRIFLAYFSLLVLGFLDSVRGPLFPDITSDLQLTDSVASLFFVGTSAMTIVTGRLTPYFAKKLQLTNLFRLSQVLLGLGCLGFSMANSFLSLFLSAVVFGLGFGFINVGQNLLILEGASRDRRRQLFSGLHGVYALASLLAPITVGLLVATGHDWRASFRFFILLCGAGFLACSVVRTPAPMPADRGATHAKGQAVASGWIFLPASIQLSLYIAAELSITTRLVLYLRRQNLADAVVAPQYLAAFFALLLAGRMLFTFLPFHKHSNQKIIMISLVSSAICYALGLYHSPFWLVMCGLTMAPIFGVFMEHLADVFPGRSEQAIAWVLAASGFFVISMHYIVGVLSQAFGIWKALHLGPAILLVSAVLLSLSTKRSQKLGRTSVKN